VRDQPGAPEARIVPDQIGEQQEAPTPV